MLVWQIYIIADLLMLLQPIDASTLGLAVHSGRQLVVLASEAQASTNKRLLPAISIYSVSSQNERISFQHLGQTGASKVTLFAQVDSQAFKGYSISHKGPLRPDTLKSMCDSLP